MEKKDAVLVIERLIADYDLSSDAGRKKAYEKCLGYADENLRERGAYNGFMKAVGEKLGLWPALKTCPADEIGEPPESAKLFLTFRREIGPELAGNVEGLRYLSAVLAELAKAAEEDDHFHFYLDEPPMVDAGYPLTVYYEPDQWFAKHATADKEEGKKQQIKSRPISVSDIRALCIFDEIPPGVFLTKGKPYKVMAVKAYEGQKMWAKEIREETDRLAIFTLTNDDGTLEDFAFDIDDPRVLFLLIEDIAVLCSSS